MSSPPPVSPPPAAPRPARPAWLSNARLPWILVALAFAVGLLLFALVTRGDREDGFFRAGSEPGAETGSQVFEPLPTPDAAGGSSIERGLPQDAPEAGSDPRSAVGETPSLDGTPASAPVEPASPPPAPADAAPAGGATVSARPVRSPRPEYPVQALRRGETGTVLLQVEVDADGHPTRVQVVQSSRSRALDRAAANAVERWEFSPALRNGQAVASRVLVPVEFNR